MKKRNQRQYDYQTMSKKVLCGKFASRLKNNFAVGDQENNLLLYNILGNKPITVLNSQTSNVSSITALTFTQTDDQVLVGSNRGSMNVWDLNTLKIAFCLKGHTVEICSFCTDARNEQIIVSGSYDTHVKVWDLRNKNCVQIIKGHNRKVSVVSFANDSKAVVSGGQDGFLQVWDLRVNKAVSQSQTGSSVLSLDVKKSGLIAAGCMDRVARIYDINSPFKLIDSTKNDSMPITCVKFYKDDVLFTAGTDILKAWNISQNVYLTDNIETSSKGLLDMIVEDKIQQIAYSSGCLSYHSCPLSEVNFKTPYIYEKQHSLQPRNQIRNSSVPKEHYHDVTNQITNEKAKKLIERKNQSLARHMVGLEGDIKDALTNVKRASEEFNKRKNQTIQLSELMQDEHTKFMKVMAARAKSIQSILEYWVKGNVKQVLQNLKITDIYTTSDILSQILKSNRGQISAEFGLVIATKTVEMIKSKHTTLIKAGVTYMLHVVSLFKDEMIRLKVFGADKGVDLARQDRIRRYDMMIEQYMEVYQSHRLKHLVSKNDQTSKLAEQLYNQLTDIFKKVFGKDQF